MKTVDIIRRAGMNLRQAKLRTALTALAISIGAFVIMTSLAFGVGIDNYTGTLINTNINERQIGVSKTDIGSLMSSGGGAGIKEYSENYSDMYRIELMDKSDMAKVGKIKGIESVTPFGQLNMRYFLIEGNDQKWHAELGNYDPLILTELVAGKLPSNEEDIAEDSIVLPEDYLESLKISAKDAIGKKILITFSLIPTEENINEFTADLRSQNFSEVQILEKIQQGIQIDYEFTVVAISKNAPLSTSTSELLINGDRYISITERTTKGTESYEKYAQLLVVVAKDEDPITVKNRIEQETGLKTLTAKEAQKMISQVTNILQIIVIGFGALALAVSVFGIINTMYISVIERTSQIGLMKALGMRSKHIAKLFRYEAAWVGFIGGALGISLSWIIGNLANPWISKQVGFSPEDGIYLLQYELGQALILQASLVIIAIISGFFPALKAAKLDPIEALRTE